MKKQWRYLLYGVGLAAWAGAVGVGGTLLFRYEAVPGKPAQAPTRWPIGSAIARSSAGATLVLAIHPQCPCSQATIEELDKLMTDCQGKLQAIVLVLDPVGSSDQWVHSDLWTAAARIPGVTVLADREGAEARRFGAATSGQALVYDHGGALIFSGGITESRGHGGDNAGEDAIAALVCGNAPAQRTVVHTAVFGCPLFNGVTMCRAEEKH